MSRVDRRSPAGRAYLDLQNQARREGRPTQQLLTSYAIERWLARLASPHYAAQFILKGGMLLAAIDTRRPTVDADALALGIPGDQITIAAIVNEIAAMPDPDGDDKDGITSAAEPLATYVIREEGMYAGVRVILAARLATANLRVSLDVNIGDPVTPHPQQVRLPSVRPGTPPVKLLGYPLETVLAEKIATAIGLGDINTRMKDYADIWTVTGNHDFGFRAVRNALAATADHRGTTVQPLSAVIVDFVTLRAPAYTAYRTSLSIDGTHLPAVLTDVVRDVVAFADALASDDSAVTAWDAATRTWR